MPRGDGTGPMGTGPGAGQGWGNRPNGQATGWSGGQGARPGGCIRGMGRGMGSGRRRGLLDTDLAAAPVGPDAPEALQRQVAALEASLATLKARLAGQEQKPATE